MKKMLSALILAMIACQTVAAPKRLVCDMEHKSGEGQNSMSIEAILETDDFAKESPEAEVTILSWKVNGEEKRGGYFTPTIGKTYRLPYSVTPTTLSITARKIVESTSSGVHLQTLNISRKDLTMKSGSCTIEDYSANNAI